LSEPAFDELLRRLAEAEAKFVVVGGLAVNAWGVVRGTKDVDVVVAPEIDNNCVSPGERRTGRNRDRPRSA
jgi:hypothetical protein